MAKTKLIILLTLLLNFTANSQEIWELAVKQAPIRYFKGALTLKETIYDKKGKVEDSFYLNFYVDDSGGIDKKYLKDLTGRVKLPDLDHNIFDPFDIKLKDYITYSYIGMIGHKDKEVAKYDFIFEHESIRIIGTCLIKKSGIPIVVNYQIDSLPIKSGGFTIISCSVENRYIDGLGNRWRVVSVTEKSEIVVKYLLAKIPLTVETRYNLKL